MEDLPSLSASFLFFLFPDPLRSASAWFFYLFIDSTQKGAALSSMAAVFFPLTAIAGNEQRWQLVLFPLPALTLHARPRIERRLEWQIEATEGPSPLFELVITRTRAPIHGQLSTAKVWEGKGQALGARQVCARAAIAPALSCFAVIEYFVIGLNWRTV